ncbi:MAG: FAD-dependent oxidoreductase, partial [Chloroflexota bacterium]
PMVENFSGFPEGIAGLELGKRMKEQAARFGLEIETAEAKGVELSGEIRIVKTTLGDFSTRAVIIAGGAAHRRLGVPGEDRLVGKGISFCATCDAFFFRDKVVAVVGGGNAAVEEAMFLTRFAPKVFLVHRRDQLRADKILQERVLASPAVEPVWDSVVVEVLGEGVVSGLRLRNVKTGQVSELAVSGVFASIGFQPDTIYLGDLLPLDPTGHIPTNERLETAVPGIYAAGDIRKDTLKQAIVAASDGATAAHSTDRYLSGR